MAVFLIADIKIIDDTWVPEYVAKVPEIVHRHGGRYLSRSAKITNVEGPALDSSIIALLQFPTMEAANAFLRDPDYLPYATSRSAGSVSNLNIIDDSDAAGTIPYLREA